MKKQHQWLRLLMIAAMIGGMTISSPFTSVNAQDGPALTQSIVTSDRNFTFSLPTAWSVEFPTDDDTVVFFGENATETANRGTFWKENSSQSVTGSGGIVDVYNINGELRAYDPDNDPITNLTNFIEAVNVSRLAPLESLKLGSTQIAYTVVDWGSQRGYLAIIPTSTEVALVFLSSNVESFYQAQRLLYLILTSFRSSYDSPLNLLVTSTDTGMSIELPTNWFFQDEWEQNSIFFFGENEDELNNRITFWNENNQQVINGNGGFVAGFQYNELLNVYRGKSAINNLTNLVDALQLDLIQDAQPIHLSGYSGAYTIVDWGRQRAYVALIDVEDIGWGFVLVSSPPRTFTNNRLLLWQILQSVALPAQSFPTPATFPTAPIRNQANTLAFEIPTNWALQTEIAEDGSERLYFAADPTELQQMLSNNSPQHGGGAIFIQPRTNAGQSLTQIFNLYAPPPDLTLLNVTTETLNEQEVMWAEFIGSNSRGYWGVIRADQAVIVIILRTAPARWQEDQSGLMRVLRSLQYNQTGL